MELTNEELDVLLTFDTTCRGTLLWELLQARPGIRRPDTRRAVDSAIVKLDAMTDAEFDALGLDAGAFDGEDYE